MQSTWLALALTCTLFAQSGPADIHPSAPNTMPEMRVRFARGRYELRNATLVDLIRTAWSVDPDNVVGGPESLGINRFDVITTAPAGSTPEALHAMLRALLQDRFQLSLHNGTKDSPTYALIAAKKPELERADASDPTTPAACSLQPDVTLVCRNIAMPAFAQSLSRVREASGYLFGYPVLDRTGLTGAWNFSLKWTPRIAQRPTPSPAEPTTLFAALEKQLGLKLNLIRVPHSVVVVDHVNEKPSPNPPGITEQLSPRLEFEVASIKPDPDHLGNSSVKIDPGGRLRINMTLQGLISEAWGALYPTRIVDTAGESRSLTATQWDVVAKAPADTDAPAGWNGPVWNGVDIDSMRMMLRALLVDRFKLVAHTEDRPLSGYALVAAKPKLRKADSTNRPGCREGPGADEKDPRLANPLASRLVTCRNLTLSQFAKELEDMMYGRAPVLDSTGIDGHYDMTINFSPPSVFQNTPGPNPQGEPVASDPNGAISIFEALSKQLGLKLQSRKVTAPVLVIDHVNEQPTEN